jgi:hypothetical protein
MSLIELEAQIASASWFDRCGQFPGGPGTVPLATVAASDDWDWLPTSHQQADPIHGDELVTELRHTGSDQARREAELAIAKCVWSALRSVPDQVPALIDGPHNYTPAAKSGAVYAARMAARELLVGRPTIWCSAVQLFISGYWPCGWSQTRQSIVVL